MIWNSRKKKIRVLFLCLLLVEARLPPAVRPGLAYLFVNRRTKIKLWS
jgi:hypothetical protein